MVTYCMPVKDVGVGDRRPEMPNAGLPQSTPPILT